MIRKWLVASRKALSGLPIFASTSRLSSPLAAFGHGPQLRPYTFFDIYSFIAPFNTTTDHHEA